MVVLLTSEIEVNGMGQETGARDAFKQRSDRDEAEVDRIRH